MSYKEKLKSLIFLFSLFLTGLFFTSNAYALELNWNNDSFIEVNSIKYQNGTAQINLKYASGTPDILHLTKSLSASGVIVFECPNSNFVGLTYGLCSNDYDSDGCILEKGETKSFNLGYLWDPYYWRGIGDTDETGITKTEIDSWQYGGTDYLESCSIRQINLYWSGQGSLTFNLSPYEDFPLSSTPPVVNGECGSANGQNLTQIPPDEEDACNSGNFINFSVGYDELGTALNYVWLCEGSGGGSSVACASANVEDPVNGECGTADGQTISSAPLEYQKCSTGSSRGSLLQTLDGWTWSCYGFNGGITDSCSAIYEEAETPPTIPETSDFPTPTDCDTYTGIDKILCNFGNTIQGMFLPSTSKITELQTTLNKINNVFPFNYLRAIGTIFTNASDITSGGLTMTILGNTETLNEDFYDIGIVEKIKDFFTFLIYLAFIWWSIGYIKHFFK